jgi:hypothetical protein
MTGWHLGNNNALPRGGMRVCCVALLCAALACGGQTSPPARTPTHPKSTAIPVVQPTRQLCMPVGAVSLSQVGNTLCVEGTVATVGADDTAWYVNFKNADLQLISYDRTINIPFQAGDCIQQTGRIEKLGSHPVLIIQIGDAYSACGGSPPVGRTIATERPVTENQPPAAPASACPNGCTSHVAGCDIKGNASFETGEKIYHVPGGEFYDATTINPDYGERWFCNQADAILNGWRKSQR